MWADGGYFAPEKGNKPAFTIVIPPPNVTGQLHLGHAFDNTLQDILIRYKRMDGFETLWMPGTDHAGIATQIKVEEELRTLEGKTRHDLGRDAFIERVWQWKETYGNRIVDQLKKLGASCDWERLRFTMDEGLSRAVREVFVALYEKGKIYRGNRITNICVCCQTALSEAEVEYEEREGSLYHIKYSDDITVATTRPETMLGDTAVAVHPEDERYKHLIGKTVTLPLMNREIPVVADGYVDKDFGTGCVKITPCHDPNDYEMAKRQNLPELLIMDQNGVINKNGGKYCGLSRTGARKAVIADLEAGGFLIKTEPHTHNVGACARCHQTIEPMASEQWFVSMKELAAPAIAAVKEGRTRFVPERFEKLYLHWLENVRDWCVSRQIWWGHRIPVFTCAGCGEIIVSREDPAACPKCKGISLTQDPDVLDTWFSSALWPFSTLGWPLDTPELKRFYPTSVLVTGFDILFFWVARMMMMGLHFMKDIPFRHCYIHALVRDAQGQKMSKSTGNVIDPLDMIAKFGTDSLRFTLTAFAAMGRDIRLSEERIEGYRHFMNKIWNASRFALMNLDEEAPAAIDLNAVSGAHHRWILHRLEELKAEQLSAIAEYRFNDAAQSLYKFVWNEFCDWYLELVKPDMQATPAGPDMQTGGERKATAQYVLWTVLREALILLHPVVPFISSEVWDALPGADQEPTLAEVPFPAARDTAAYAGDAARMEMAQAAIVAVRTIRAELNIAPSLKLAAVIRPCDEAAGKALEEQREVIMVLARLESLTIDPAAEAPKVSASDVVCGNEIIVPLFGAVDFAAENARLDKELAKMDKEHAMLSGKLANENYVQKAPQDVVERDKARVTELEDARKKLLTLKERYLDA
jgi:valyl-tRNA synthetase